MIPNDEIESDHLAAKNIGPQDQSLDAIDLAGLVTARLCHDLISPIGAIGNGLELLEMTKDLNGDEMGLIGSSTQMAVARIKYYRLAFGPTRPGQEISRKELATICAQTNAAERISVKLQTCPEALLRSHGRMVLLAHNCLETTLPWGGHITLNHSGQESRDMWCLTATAERVKIDPVIWAVFSEPTRAESFTPATVQFALLKQALAAEHMQLVLTQTNESVTLRLEPF